MKGLRISFVINVTFLIALLLTIIPLPDSLSWYRPAWVLMVLLFWLITIPYKIGIIPAFFLGLIFDFLTGTLLGLHALAFSLIAYIMIKLNAQVRSLPIWQQMIFIFLIIISYMALIYWILALLQKITFTWRYWLPAITSTFLWPWVFAGLRSFWDRYKVQSFQ